MVEAKTTLEIVEDYNHKAPDSLLCGDELWFRKDERDKEEVEFLESIQYYVSHLHPVIEMINKRIEKLQSPLAPDVSLTTGGSKLHEECKKGLKVETEREKQISIPKTPSGELSVAESGTSVSAEDIVFIDWRKYVKWKKVK